jgi:hypothetical protein
MSQLRLTNPFQREQIPTLPKALERQQHTYLDNRGTTEQKKRQRPRKQRVLSERLSINYQTKRRLVGILERLGEIDLVERITLCGSKFSAVTCGKHIVQKRPYHKCDFRLCPYCAPRRSSRILAKYLPMAAAFVRHSLSPVTPCHIVLTLKHRPGETLDQSRKRLLGAFKKLSKRSFWNKHFAGGIRAVETTAAKDGCWHTHLHVLAFRRSFFDVDLLRSEWLAVTGDSHVVRIDRVTDLQTGLREVVKYISKPLDINSFSTHHIKQFLEIKGARMFSAFGEFAEFCKNYEPSDNEKAAVAGGERVDYCEGDCCPICDAPLFEIPMTVEDLIGFARRLESVPRINSSG